MANIEQVNLLLEREYARTSRILRNGELFVGVQNEKANVKRAIDNLVRTSEHQQKQQEEVINRKYQLKIDSLQSLQKKLMAQVNNPAMLKPEDISRTSSMLGEMQQLLESQRSYEIETSNKEVEARSNKSIEDYRQRSQMVIEKHFQDAKSRLDSLMATFEPLEEYYETASFDSQIWNDLKNESTFPILSQIRLGETGTNIENLSMPSVSYKTPEIVPFFNQNSLTIVYKEGERDKLKNLVDNILLRCLMSAENGNILFHFMDGNGNGSLFFDYLKCSNKTLQLFDGKINITPQEIEGSLQKLQLTYKEIDQKIRKGESIIQYNERNPKAMLPYHVVVMDSFPKGMSSSYIPFVTRLLKDELAAGLHFVFLVEEDDLHKVADLTAFTSVYRFPQNYLTQTSMRDIQEKTLQYVDKNYTKEKTMLFEEYYTNVEWWEGNCSNYTRIPLGLSYANNYDLFFDEEGKGGLSSAHTVIVGTSGCGKSSLLNTIIMGASIVYSPNELHFFLIDMKGVGFKQYADEKLPHAEFIALKANPMFGLHTLQNIEKMVKARSEYFRSKGVNDYNEFRNRFPSEIMPRYMIVIDEYQELLRDETRMEVTRILDYLLLMSRAFGFNLIMSSQNLHLSDNLMVNVHCRIVMRCPSALGRLALGEYNDRTADLNTGQAIIKCSSTDVVQSYYLPKDEKELPSGASMTSVSYLKIIKEKWSEITNGMYDHHLVVFDSEQPALLSNNRTYKSLTYNRDIINTGLLFSPGEKYMVDGKDFMQKITLNKNENILVVGGKLQVSTRVANTTFLSILPQIDVQSPIDIVSFQDRSDKILVNAINRSSNEVCERFPNANFHKLPQDITPLLDELIEDIEQRTELLSRGESITPRLLLIYRADKNPQFTMMVSEGRISTKKVLSEHASKVKQILETGPQVGVFCILHFSDAIGFFNMFSEEDKVHFNHRILLQMNNEAHSKVFLDSPIRKDASHLVDNEASENNKYNVALYKNAYDNSEPIKIKPYEFLN